MGKTHERENAQGAQFSRLIKIMSLYLILRTRRPPFLTFEIPSKFREFKIFELKYESKRQKSVIYVQGG